MNFDQRGMEMRVLWAAREGREAAEMMLGELDPEDFTAPDTRAAFDAIRALMALQDEAPGWPGMLREMRTRGVQSVELFMADMALEFVSLSNLPPILRELRRARQLRDIRKLVLATAERADGSLVDGPELARNLEAQARAILELGERRDPVPIAEVLAHQSMVGASPTVPTGIPELDQSLRIGEGNLVTIGARPGVGKSALLLSLARAAADGGWQSLVFSFEMSAAELRGRIDQQGGSGASIWVQESLRGLDTHAAVQSITGNFIRRYADRPTVVLIDYLQLLKPTGRYQSRREQVAEVVRELKRMAMSLKCPVVIAAQLNRNADDPSRPPQLSDLKETGEIEEASDAVLLLHRPNPEQAEARLRIAKNRHGPAHRTIHLIFLSDQVRFVPAALPGADPFSDPETFFAGA